VALLLLALPLLLSAVSRAQEEPAQPAAPPFGEEVEVTEVLLDVLVTDRDGNVIVGLRPEDFVVEEGGRPIPLLDVSFYSNRPQLDAEGKPVRAAGSERYFVLFFHDQRAIHADVPGLLGRQLEGARRSREWLSTLQLDDWVAVVSYSTSLQVHQDFSRDREAAGKAIEAAAKGALARGNWESRLPPEGQPSLLRNMPRGRKLLRASDTVYEALETVAHAADPLVGRKNLVLFSTGFGRVNVFNQYEPEARYFEPMARALNDGNVAVYAIDLAPTGVDIPIADALASLANRTGGRYYDNVVNLGTPLEQTAEEATGYYLIAYQAPHPRGRAGFQPVEVKVKNPEFQVKARAGYSFGGE
jgi:VWFA-related protein